MYLATYLRWQLMLIDYAVRIWTTVSGFGQVREECGREFGGPSRNRTGVHGFAVRCVTTPPRGQVQIGAFRVDHSLYRSETLTTIVSQSCVLCVLAAEVPVLPASVLHESP